MRPTGIAAILKRFRGVRRSGDGWVALCPAHPDRNPSLSINQRDGKILLHCHTGCLTESICAALGIEMRDLFVDGNSPPRIAATYDYTNERGELLFQVVRYDPKHFKQRRPDGKGGWIWKVRGVRRVLYHLPEVLQEKCILVVEGEKDVEAARKMGFVATCNPNGVGKWHEEYSKVLRDKRIVVIVDADEPGRKHAQAVAQSLYGKAQSLKLLELPRAKDLSEWVERGGTREALLELIRNAPECKPQTVEGGVALDPLVAYIRRFVFLSESQARVVALWVVHTHAFVAADATPYLSITSAEKESGKTRLLEVLEVLVAKPWLTGRVTAAVLVRKVDADQPTLLLDESDAAFRGEKEYAEALRGVLNTGHRRGGKASCCVGQGANISARDFSTFCPKAIAGIGKLPDTVAGRSIPIRLKRAAPGEKVCRFRRREVEREAAELREEIQAGSLSIAPKLQSHHPYLPEALTDRQQDCAEPLLAIADLAGGEWPEAARRALVELWSHALAADESVGIRLLADIRTVFQARGTDRLKSVSLADELAKLETSPWAEWSKGKPLTANGLASLLKPFEIGPHSIRMGAETAKGYQIEDFDDAWLRYLRVQDGPSCPYPPSGTVTPSQPSKNAPSSHFAGRHTQPDVTAEKCEKANKNGPCDGVTVQTPAPEGEGGQMGFFEGEL